MNIQPKILLHPNLPAPLHGLSPRSIKGQAWWDIQRRAAYAEKDFHCHACGIHKSLAKYAQQLEAHEQYTIDYEKGKMEISGIVALCPLCHSFIHNGRLEALYRDSKIGYERFAETLWRGQEILISNGLKMNPFAAYVMIRYGVGVARVYALLQTVGAEDLPDSDVAWEDWRMVLDGVEYAPLWKNEAEHKSFYSNKG